MKHPMTALLGLRSPEGTRGRLVTLIFHRVLSRPDPLFPDELDARRFEAVCRWVASMFNVLPLDHALRLLRDGSLPARAAALTFDDGYADNHDVALPILKRHGLHATFFVASGFLDGGRMFNDSVIEAIRRTRHAQLDLRHLGIGVDEILSLATWAHRRQAIDRLLHAVKYLAPSNRAEAVSLLTRYCGTALPSDLMMTSAQLRAMHRAGMGIGAHTRNHPILARLNEEDARDEIHSGREDIEQLIDAKVALFAYPNGKPGDDYTAETVEIVRRLGFDAAVSTAWGAASVSSDFFQIPRFTPWDRSSMRFGWRLLSNYSRPSLVHAPPAGAYAGQCRGQGSGAENRVHASRS